MCTDCVRLTAANDQLEAQIIDLRVDKQIADATVAVYEEKMIDLVEQLKDAQRIRS